RAQARRRLSARVPRWPGRRRQPAGPRRGARRGHAACGAQCGRAMSATGPAPPGLAGLRLAHPVINGSGTFDAIAARRTFGDGLEATFPFAAFVSKTITLEPRAGNPPPRLWETGAGLLNSIGLPNKGLAAYLAEDLPALAEICAAATVPAAAHGNGRDGGNVRGVPLITNVM